MLTQERRIPIIKGSVKKMEYITRLPFLFWIIDLMNGTQNRVLKTNVLSHHRKSPMTKHQPYRPFSSCPHTYGRRRRVAAFRFPHNYSLLTANCFVSFFLYFCRCVKIC